MTPVFQKTGPADVLRTELVGLEWLAEAIPDNIPGNRRFVENEDYASGALYMDAIRREAWSDAHWESAARVLSRLHGFSAGSAYGLEYDNHIGPTPQNNRFHEDWVSFFANCRLQEMAHRLDKAHAWDPAWTRPFDLLIAELDRVLPRKP